MAFETELKAALDSAVKAGHIHSAMRKGLLGVSRKDDNSPVTEVDKKSEKLIIDILSEAFPSDGFLGEETGQYQGTSGRKWIIDPLDGTRPYIKGIPTSSVLIALEEDNEPVLGVIHLPFLNETYFAVKGGGAFLNNNPIHVSQTLKLEYAMGSALGIIEHAGSIKAGSIIELLRNCDYSYGFMDAYSYGSIAAGRLDLCVNLMDKPWDCAAAACIISEAGGCYSDLLGRKSIYSGSIIFSNSILHEQILEFFSGTERPPAGKTRKKGGTK
jgi:histidinol phosphatase-like enzyme (inositol monophosphatase family)